MNQCTHHSESEEDQLFSILAEYNGENIDTEDYLDNLFNSEYEDEINEHYLLKVERILAIDAKRTKIDQLTREDYNIRFTI